MFQDQFLFSKGVELFISDPNLSFFLSIASFMRESFYKFSLFIFYILSDNYS